MPSPQRLQCSLQQKQESIPGAGTSARKASLMTIPLKGPRLAPLPLKRTLVFQQTVSVALPASCLLPHRNRQQRYLNRQPVPALWGTYLQGPFWPLELLCVLLALVVPRGRNQNRRFPQSADGGRAAKSAETSSRRTSLSRSVS